MTIEPPHFFTAINKEIARLQALRTDEPVAEIVQCAEPIFHWPINRLQDQPNRSIELPPP